MERIIRDISANIDGISMKREVNVYRFKVDRVDENQLAERIYQTMGLRLIADRYADGFIESKGKWLEICFYRFNEPRGFEHEDVELRKSDNKVDELKLEEIVNELHQTQPRS